MKKSLILPLTVFISILYIFDSQTVTRAQQNNNEQVQNDFLGISFAKVGSIEKIDSSTYSIILSSSNNSPISSNNSSIETANAYVSVSRRLFLDLPGSYGGKVYLDSKSAISLFKERVLVDSLNTGKQNFCREYWAVYAGMGMWDCVINSYVKRNGLYYIVSLVQDKLIGKPGEIVNGKPLKSEDLKLKIVSSLQDTSNSIVDKYNKLLASFQIRN